MAIRFDDLEKHSDERIIVKVSAELHARLLAQEYIRNGMNLQAAYRKVTGKETAPTANRIQRLTRHRVDEFIDELRLQLEHADIDKQRILEQLYDMLQVSILDFFDENGRFLPIEDLKKLPRSMQRLLSVVKVEITERPLIIANKVMRDEDGNVMTIKTQKVHVELPPKIDAIKQLALIMRWVGPTVVVNNNVSVGVLMSRSNERLQRLDGTYAHDEIPMLTHDASDTTFTPEAQDE